MGVDVSSKRLDLYFPDTGESKQIANKEEAIAKLVGVAPMNRDSGANSGKRFIFAGRSYVRAVLYMATIAAIRFNPQIKAYYQHHKAKGKPSKVAIVACMRKFITTLNYLIKTNQLWNSQAAAAA